MIESPTGTGDGTVRVRRPNGAAPELIGRSAAVARVQEFVRRVAAADGGVLLVAEAGADVESVALELHVRGRAPAAPFVCVDCGAESLDRMLFGGDDLAGGPSDLEQVARDSGIAAARGGTLFLQNVAEIPASVQSRLARVARDGEVRIDGAPVSTSLRLVASAVPGVDAEVRHHRFRVDLYRRLSVSRIDLPPLRARPDDVPAIASRLLEDCCVAQGAAPRAFTQAALGLLAALSWPGNLAELREVIQRVVASGGEHSIPVEQLLPALPFDRAPMPFAPSGTLREARQRFERDYIASVLQHHNWRMADAAETLGIQRPNLYRKARQLGIPIARSTD